MHVRLELSIAAKDAWQSSLEAKDRVRDLLSKAMTYRSQLLWKGTWMRET